MAPIASGTLPPSTLIHSFLNWKSLVAIAVGVIVSWLGGRGVTLMGSQPQLVAGCWWALFWAWRCFAEYRLARLLPRVWFR
ncbi:inner membrane protein [Escherichia coli]|uniref:Inner membrane protein n=1 Tax=Escherichia coli TaxID=562 RepID=A0A376VGU0_ECOLX|nr:inner membrane protein [Escherichia coli]